MRQYFTQNADEKRNRKTRKLLFSTIFLFSKKKKKSRMFRTRIFFSTKYVFEFLVLLGVDVTM